MPTKPEQREKRRRPGVSSPQYVIRCFKDGLQRQTDELSAPEAQCFLSLAEQLARYLREEYGVTTTVRGPKPNMEDKR
jgi:hypothetical protein